MRSTWNSRSAKARNFFGSEAGSYITGSIGRPSTPPRGIDLLDRQQRGVELCTLDPRRHAGLRKQHADAPVTRIILYQRHNESDRSKNQTVPSLPAA